VGRSISTTLRPTPKRQNLVCTQHGRNRASRSPGRASRTRLNRRVSREGARTRLPAVCPAGRWTAPRSRRSASWSAAAGRRRITSSACGNLFRSIRSV